MFLQEGDVNRTYSFDQFFRYFVPVLLIVDDYAS